jgi:hypothetical protein
MPRFTGIKCGVNWMVTLVSGGERKLFLDFRQMPVLRHAVRPDAFVAFAKQVIHLGLAARAAHAAQRIGDDAGRLDQLRHQQRNQRQQDAGRVTARGGDEHRFLDFIAVDFRQTINRLVQQIRRGMVVRVKFLVHLRAPEPEIGAEVNHDAAALSSGTANSAATPCGSARNTTSACFASSSAFGSVKRSVFGFRMAGKFGEHLRERLPGVLARGHGHQLHVRMVQQQPDEFLAGVTGRADDGDFLRIHFQKFNHENTNHTKKILRDLVPLGQFSDSVRTGTTGVRFRFQTKNPAGLNQRGLEISSAINVSRIGSVCARPAGRISCALSCANRA